MDAANNAGGENIGWVDYMLRVMWPNIREVLKKKVVEAVMEKASEELKAKHISVERLEVGFDPGMRPPKLLEIRAYEAEEDGISGLQVDVDLLWESDETFKIHPQIKGSYGSLGFRVRDVQVTHIRFEGTVSIVLAPLVETPPCFGAVQLFFFDPPRLDMTIRGLELGTADFLLHQLLEGVMRSTALGVMRESFILPQRLMVKVQQDLAFDELVRIRSPLPKGLLEIEVMQGRGLIAGDPKFLGKAASSDPFVVISLMDAKMRTSTVESNLNPSWEDGPDYLLVYNLNQLVQIELFDADRFSADDPIGHVQGYTVYHLLTTAGDKPDGHWFDIKMKEKEGGQLLLRVRYLSLETLPRWSRSASSLSKDSCRSGRNNYAGALPHLVTVRLLGLEVDNPAAVTGARATVVWSSRDMGEVAEEAACASQQGDSYKSLAARGARVLKNAWRGLRRLTTSAAGAATKLISFKEREPGIATKRTSVNAMDWQGQLERISARKPGAVPVNVARAIARLRDRDEIPLETIAEWFGLDLATTKAAANLRANFGVAWHQAFHFLQAAGQSPGACSVSIEVKLANRAGHHATPDKLRNKEGLVGSVRADFLPRHFAAPAQSQSQTPVCHVRAPLRRKDLDEKEPQKDDGRDSDGEYFVNDSLCDASLGRPVPGATVEFSVELRSLKWLSSVGRMAGGQKPTPMRMDRISSRAVAIKLVK